MYRGVFIDCARDQSTQHSSSFEGAGLETEFYWERPEQKPITALEEIAKLLSSFSSKNSCCFSRFTRKVSPTSAWPRWPGLILKCCFSSFTAPFIFPIIISLWCIYVLDTGSIRLLSNHSQASFHRCSTLRLKAGLTPLSLTRITTPHLLAQQVNSSLLHDWLPVIIRRTAQKRRCVN